MNILHLGFEDPRQPGAGGGSWRAHNINRRLANRHQITVLAHRYPGAQAGRYDGVLYVPVGIGTGRMAALTYWTAVERYARRMSYDVLIEEFGPPVGSGFAPLFARAPVIGSVQWLFADAMQHKYHLPFLAVQQRALHLYRDLITMTAEMADKLGAEIPGLLTHHVPNGLNDEDFVPHENDSGDIVLLGRLDVQQKGLDLALQAVAALPNAPGRLLIAGDGPDRPLVERQIAALGLQSRVMLIGRVEGDAKRELLRRARVLLMPSRHETFGIVALEAFAAGCPVVAFDIPGLREVAVGPAARLVKPYDLPALATALREWWFDDGAARAAGSHGPTIARRYSWDAIALRQEAVYREVVAGRERVAA
jgi:glycogen(starch) synthase